MPSHVSFLLENAFAHAAQVFSQDPGQRQGTRALPFLFFDCLVELVLFDLLYQRIPKVIGRMPVARGTGCDAVIAHFAEQFHAAASQLVGDTGSDISSPADPGNRSWKL
jgi:hypothetical protein